MRRVLGASNIIMLLLLVACGGQQAPTTHTLTVTITGDGTVTATAAGQAVTLTGGGNTRTATVAEGTTLVLTATPADATMTTTWTGCDSTNAAARTCTVTMNANENVSVTFAAAAANDFNNVAGTVTDWQGGAGTIRGGISRWDEENIVTGQINDRGEFSATYEEPPENQLTAINDLLGNLCSNTDNVQVSADARILGITGLSVFNASDEEIAFLNPSSNDSYVDYVYADRDTTLNGTCDLRDSPGWTHTFSGTLKEGWNAVQFTTNYQARSTSASVLSNPNRLPAGLQWYPSYSEKAGDLPPLEITGTITNWSNSTATVYSDEYPPRQEIGSVAADGSFNISVTVSLVALRPLPVFTHPLDITNLLAQCPNASITTKDVSLASYRPSDSRYHLGARAANYYFYLHTSQETDETSPVTTSQMIEYIYATKNLTIKGECDINIPASEATPAYTERVDYDVTLQAGWNAVLVEEQLQRVRRNPDGPEVWVLTLTRARLAPDSLPSGIEWRVAGNIPPSEPHP